MSIRFERLGGYIGAEVAGVDLSKTLDTSVVSTLREGLNTYGVLVIRDQDVDVERYMRFGECFGPLFINKSPAAKPIPGFPMVEDMRKEADETTNIGDEWHTDQAHRENPCWLTMLHAIDVPAFGGDTSFLSVAAAYEFLPQRIKDAIEHLEAEHSSEFLIRNAIERTGNKDGRFDLTRATVRAVHRVVKTHPENGRKVLYVNPGYTSHFVGWTHDDSRTLLDVLYRYATRQEFICRVRWRPGTVTMWDNRQVWHYAANDYHGQRREMRRLVVNAPDIV